MDNAIQPAKGGFATEPAAASQEADLTGQVLGEFRLLHRLGRGGMGQVYLAEQLSLKRKVALKLLHPDMASNERSLLRFKAEAENIARATHANIVQVYTIGQANGLHYIALEYVEGKNLREFIERKGTPELSLGLHIMSQVAGALQRASELGVLHRDVKPENIMLTKKGEVKVADFGLSRCIDGSNQQHITQSQVVMGTPLYISPEQVERKPIDSRTDIYSFGVTCYHMFAGHPPFRGNNPVEVAYQHLHQEPVPLGEIRPDLPIELCRIIHKMMAKKPDERYQTAREVDRDINRLRESLNLGAIAAISISSTFLGSAPDGASAISGPTQTWPVPRPRLSWWLVVPMVLSVLFAVGAGLLGGWFIYQRDVGPKDQQQAPPPVLEDPPPPKALVTARERERELRSWVEKYAQPENPVDVDKGVEHSLELALFYLKERKYTEADQFFTDLRSPERKIVSYHMLGRIGNAIVLAFKDDFAQSNKAFVVLASDFDRIEKRFGRAKFFNAEKLNDEAKAYWVLWMNNPRMREMAARALHHNHANAPEQFPKELEVYRFPPRPTLKPPPMP